MQQQPANDKQCFKCREWKARADFYRHPMMADGLLGKCKECAKRDVAENYRSRFEAKRAYEAERFKRPERKEALKRYLADSRRRSPEKARARNAVSNAIRDGRLARQPCEACGTNEKVQAHHEDYSKPLDVRWLCFGCHRREHGQLNHEAA